MANAALASTGDPFSHTHSGRLCYSPLCMPVADRPQPFKCPVCEGQGTHNKPPWVAGDQPTATETTVRVECHRGHFLGRWPAGMPFPFSFRPWCSQCRQLTTPNVEA